MKGFPNQVSDFGSLARALRALIAVQTEGGNPKDDGVFGEFLIRSGVLRTGHTPIPVDEYLQRQKAIRSLSNQSYRTRARGLRETFRILGLIDDTGSEIVITPSGRRIAALADEGLAPETIRIWREVILDISHDGGDRETSHPYQVLLRLVAMKPGIIRAKCALALEAKNDSDQELERIIGLVDLDEEEIRRQIEVTESTWDNAKKILPRFAEQLGDVRKTGQRFYLSDTPGANDRSPGAAGVEVGVRGPRRPRTSREVTAGTIASSGTADDWDESEHLDGDDIDPAVLRAQIAKTRERLRRHNLLVRKLAGQLESEGAELFEHPFDCLACFPGEGILVEVKSLDGTEADEIIRVREALSQLLYYEAFVTHPVTEGRALKKIACFEHKISDRHIEWFQANDINVIWDTEDSGFSGTETDREGLTGHLGF
ncbi:hypothetical protein ACFLT7_03900 [candidate division KSB1 bacterium]